MARTQLELWQRRLIYILKANSGNHVLFSFWNLQFFLFPSILWLMEPASFRVPSRQAIRSFALLAAVAATTALHSPCHSARRWREPLVAALATRAPTLPLPKPPPPPQSDPGRRRKITDGTARVTCTDPAKSCRNQNTRQPTTKSTKICCWPIISVMRGRKERACRASILARWGHGGRVQGPVWRLVDSRVIRLQRRNGRQMMSLPQSPWTETILISTSATVSAFGRQSPHLRLSSDKEEREKKSGTKCNHHEQI